MATLSPMAGHGSGGNSFSTPDLEEHHRQKQMQQKHANLDMMHMAKDEATSTQNSTKAAPTAEGEDREEKIKLRQAEMAAMKDKSKSIFMSHSKPT
ncbi:hypothetical protein BGZ52_012911, partial [Haplosporangium bisporale]